MDSSALVMSCHVAKVETPWIRKLQEGTWLSSMAIGFGGYSVKNTFLHEPVKDEELYGMRRHHSEPKLPSSFCSTEFGEERQLPTLSSSSAASSCLSSDRMDETSLVCEDVTDDEEFNGVTQIKVTAFSAEVVGTDDDLPSGSAAASLTEWPQQEMRRHSCMAAVTTRGGVSQGESECTAERKSPSDSVPRDGSVSKKGSPEGTPPLDEMPWDDNVTTVMIRQLPLQCTQAMLMQEITSRGFGNVFDFLYLPYDVKKRENVGYGFINFFEPGHALAFRDSFDGTYLPLMARRKLLNVHPARLQGYEANYKHFVLPTPGSKKTPPRFSPVFLPRNGSPPSKMLSTGFNRTTNPRHSKASGSQKVQRAQKQQHMFCHMCGTKQLVGFRCCVNCGIGLQTAVSNIYQN